MPPVAVIRVLAEWLVLAEIFSYRADQRDGATLIDRTLLPVLFGGFLGLEGRFFR